MYDFSYSNKCPTYFCFRVGHDFNTLVNPDYFYSIHNLHPTGGPTKPYNALDIKSNLDLLIERNTHTCQIKGFRECFKEKFISGDKPMLTSKSLNYFFKDESKLEQVGNNFIKLVT
jgi:hypothetical protein